MLSSWQIASIHSQQAQSFGQQQQYSQQLSAQMPAPYQGMGLGQTGFAPQGLGMNYGHSFGASYGPGNSFGNTMTSGIGGVAHAAGTALNFGGSIAGGIAGGMMGGPIGSFIGGQLGGLPGAVIQHVAGAAMEGAHEQASMERTLSQFQFQNAGSRSGRGFNRNDSMQIGNMVRSMERMPEMLTSFGELNRVMDKMGQMGLMQGVKDASDFMTKFKSHVETFRDLAKVMGTTMEGAMQAFGEARMGGFYSKGDILKNVLNRQVTGAVTGMNSDQVNQLQSYGAELGHATGGSRKSGSANMLRTANQLGMANQMGILTNDQIMEMTGKEGAEGIQDLAGSMGQLSYKMGNSNVGQALTLALGKQVNGRYTGEMDQELVEQVRSGRLSLSQLKSMARSKAGTRGAKLSFSAHSSRLRSEMAGAVGAEGMGMELQEILGERGWQNPDAQNLVMQRFGASEEQANLLQQLMPNLQNIGSELAVAGKQQARKSAMDSSLKEHGWDAIKHKITTKIGHYTTDWAKDLGVGVRDYFQNFADDFVDDLTGQYRTYVTKDLNDTLRNSLGGSSAAKAKLGMMMNMGRAATAGLGGARLDVGSSGGLSGTAARAMSWASGDETPGEHTEALVRMAGGKLNETSTGGRLTSSVASWASGGLFGTSDSSGDVAARSGDTVLSRNSGWLSDKSVSMSAGSYADALKMYDDAGKNGQALLSKLEKSGNMGGATWAYRQAVMDPKVMAESDPSKRLEMIEGKMKDFGASGSGDTFANGMSNTEVISAVQTRERNRGKKWSASVDISSKLLGVNLDGTAAIGKAIESQNKEMTDNLKSTSDQMGWGEITKMVDDGDQVGKYLVGDDGSGGILGTKVNKATKVAAKELLASDPKDWSSPEKEMLSKQFGVNPDVLAQALQDPEKRRRLLGAVNSGDLNGASLAKHIGLTTLSGLSANADSIKKVGNDIANNLRDHSKSFEKQNVQGRMATSMMAFRAARLQGLDKDTVAGYTDNAAEIAMYMRTLSPEQRSIAMEGADDSIIAAGNVIDTGYRKLTTGAGPSRQLNGAKGTKGMHADELLKALGINAGTGNNAEMAKAEIDKMLGSGGLSDKKGLDAALLSIGNSQAKGLLGNSETKSSQVSEQEVATQIAKLSDNNVKVATIIGNLAAGKSGDDLMKGYSPPQGTPAK